MPSFNPLRMARKTGRKTPTRDEMKKLMTIDADSGHMRNVIEELLRMGTRSWQIGGNGEPFLYKDTMELIGILKHAGSHCLANTNGTLINVAMADELIKMKFDELRITTMAGTPGVYVRTHPGSTEEMFNKLKKNLLYIADQKIILNIKRPKITLVFIVIAQNFDTLFEFAEFAAHVGADRVLYRPVDDVGDPGLANTVPNEEQAVSVREQLKEVKPFLESRGIGHNIGYFKNVFREQLNTEILYTHIPCYYGWLSTVVDPDGNVYPCCRCYAPLGNVHENKFSDIWNGRSYRHFRKDGINLNKRRKPVRSCDCYSCVHHTANLKVFKRLHPVRERSLRISSL
jgi:radical SAM protein with 4Fe4S-binding SPASM domain